MLSITALAQALAVLPALAAGAKIDYDSFGLREVGARNTMDWRMWITKDGKPISTWHDVPLYEDEEKRNIVSFVVEIPRWTDAKIEIREREPLNPIFHDTRNGAVRFVESVWPHKTYPVLYGSIPQTWEDPNFDHLYTGFPGDNDPMDLFDVSGIEEGYIGQVKQVKVLGALAMIDGDETDWKVIAIDVRDPLAEHVESVEDLEKYRPGLAQEMYDWFIYYKVPRGSSTNTIIGGDYVNATFTADIIHESHEYWLDLIKGRSDPGRIMRNQTSNPRFCSSYIDKEETEAEFDIPTEDRIEPAEKKPAMYEYWYYLDDNFELIQVPE